MNLTIKDLYFLTGGLSTPSKMPGFGYGLPSEKCILGSLLAKVKGTICHSCYTFRGFYVFPCVKKAQKKRLATISRPEWVEWMTELISRKYRNRTGKNRVFRWHDSGDLQSVEHLSKIVQIAKNLPDIRFWLPTRERKIIRAYGKDFPVNLTVRMSVAMVSEKPRMGISLPQSTVSSGVGYACPARSQGNQCGPCRACWDPNVASVDYELH